ncbi:hypothetical protein KIN20_017444 [Parelaphostrongylus tenuis]|uniref:Uncharacterized protein n=1 Tax=Parelaphostrongylus tenuis TaxID=148309 RepID=A0AAD5QNN3_PARTN|nr:hypothetical protein KIN20_017444 [Parelaphostrongylus tenuis]
MDAQGRRLDDQRVTLFLGLTSRRQTLELIEKLSAYGQTMKVIPLELEAHARKQPRSHESKRIKQFSAIWKRLLRLRQTIRHPSNLIYRKKPRIG